MLRKTEFTGLTENELLIYRREFFPPIKRADFVSRMIYDRKIPKEVCGSKVKKQHLKQ